MKFIQGNNTIEKIILSLIQFKYSDNIYYTMLITERNMNKFSDPKKISKKIHIFDIDLKFILSFDSIVNFDYLIIVGRCSSNSNGSHYYINREDWNFKMNKINEKVLKL